MSQENLNQQQSQQSNQHQQQQQFHQQSYSNIESNKYANFNNNANAINGPLIVQTSHQQPIGPGNGLSSVNNNASEPKQSVNPVPVQQLPNSVNNSNVVVNVTATNGKLAYFS
jgi:hypothetical protein